MLNQGCCKFYSKKLMLLYLSGVVVTYKPDFTLSSLIINNILFTKLNVEFSALDII